MSNVLHFVFWKQNYENLLDEQLGLSSENVITLFGGEERFGESFAN